VAHIFGTTKLLNILGTIEDRESELNQLIERAEVKKEEYQLQSDKNAKEH